MDCPHCKAVIDDDSAFCDQCGAEILRCELCGRPGKGKRCIHDGKNLVPARQAGAPAPAATPAPPSAPTPAPAVSAPALRLRLACAAHGIDFCPEPGAVLGRRAGNHAALFAPLSQISGKHAEIRQPAPGQWQVADLGSTNGTRVNGQKLAPNVPQALVHGGVLTLADVAFNVSLEPAP